TRYVKMLLQLEDISAHCDLFAAFSTWILLAGFVVLPGTFAAMEASGCDGKTAAHYVQRAS
ncbi:hypothetical protein BU15DRAFT_51405, partial [Melanogaster broomeanus]